METPGARLKKLRLERGLSLEEVHKKTKIHLDILKAIEEDSLINLSPIYTKGFLKIYCKFLGVDPRDFIPDLKEPKIPPTFEYVKDEAKPLSLFKTASIKLSSFRPRIKIKIVFSIVFIIIFVIGLFYLGKMVSAKRSSLSRKVELKKVETAKSLTNPVVNIIRLTIRAKEDCWIRLKSDAHLVFQGILKKGRFETWQAKEKIELSLGNAGGVILEVNGKIISKLGRRGQALKNIFITKEGLSVAR